VGSYQENTRKHTNRVYSERSVREEPVETGISVCGSEAMKCCADGDVLVNRHRLAVGGKQWRVVIVVGNSHFYVRRVNVTWVCVLHVHRHVEQRM